MIITGNLQRRERRILERAAHKAKDVLGGFRYGNCFANAQALTLADKTGTIAYHEGYATCLCGDHDCPNGDERFPHAFNSIEGVIVDGSMARTNCAYEIVHTFSTAQIRARIAQCMKEGHQRFSIAALPGSYTDGHVDENGVHHIERSTLVGA